jgi:hypothetical protein
MISSGTVAIGHGGAGERSVGGGSPRMERLVNSLMRFCKGWERPCREWCAVLGTVTEALDGVGSCGLEAICGAGWGGFSGGLGSDLKYDGGKCFALYILSTLSSSWACQNPEHRLYYDKTDLEGFPVQTQTVSQSSFGLFLYSFFIMFQGRSWFLASSKYSSSLGTGFIQPPAMLSLAQVLVHVRCYFIDIVHASLPRMG